MRTLTILSLFMLMGCSGTTTTEIRREPARVRFIEIDTRPVPVANHPESPDSCHPLARVLAVASLGVEPPKPQPISVKPNGEVTLPPDFKGRVTVGEAEGEKPSTKGPNGGSWSSALTFVSNTTRTTPKGAACLVLGSLVFAGGVACFFLGGGLRLSIGLAAGGLAICAVGAIASAFGPVEWLVLAIVGGLIGYVIWSGRRGKDAEATVDTVTPVVEDLPRIILGKLAVAMPEADGVMLADVATEAAAAVKGAIGGKAKAKKADNKVERAVKRSKRATGTETVYRGS